MTTKALPASLETFTLPRMIAYSSLGKLAVFASVLVALEGCAGSLSQPFNAAKTSNAQITVYRLQNFEPPAAAAPGAATPFQIPPQVAQWGAAITAMLPPGLIPPGILPGSAAPTPDASANRFHDFRILGWAPLQDPKQHDELLDLLGHNSNFTTPKENCMYAEFGVSIAQAGQPPADILVSLSCAQVSTFGFAWPYGNNNGLTGDADKRVIELVKKAFGGG